MFLTIYLKLKNYFLKHLGYFAKTISPRKIFMTNFPFRDCTKEVFPIEACEYYKSMCCMFGSY